MSDIMSTLRLAYVTGIVIVYIIAFIQLREPATSEEKKKYPNLGDAWFEKERSKAWWDALVIAAIWPIGVLFNVLFLKVILRRGTFPATFAGLFPLFVIVLYRILSNN